jgi:hypothetical protein
MLLPVQSVGDPIERERGILLEHAADPIAHTKSVLLQKIGRPAAPFHGFSFPPSIFKVG